MMTRNPIIIFHPVRPAHFLRIPGKAMDASGYGDSSGGGPTPDFRAATNAGQGFASVLETSIPKTFADEMSIGVTDTAIQIHGS